jgi:hypothetical protein
MNGRAAWVALGASAALAISLLAAAPARAGGQFVDLAVGGSRLWLVGESGTHELDATTGRIRATPTLPRAAYPLTVALAGGAAWVGSVENGFVDGTLSRIDAATGKLRVVWRKQQSSVQYVAAGAGSVWALIGVGQGMEAARFRTSGRLLRVWKLPRDAGRMAADSSGCWISSNGMLLHIDPRGRLHRALQAPFGDVATGAGAVWLAQNTKVIRIDEQTGQTRSIPTGRLRLGGFQHDLAATSDALYLLQHSYTAAGKSQLVRIDLRTGSVTRSTLIAGVADAVVVAPHAVWVATATSNLSRYDSRTLRRTLVVSVP